MTDLACWRQHNGIVLRIHGTEHLLTEDEFDDLLGYARAIETGAIEACSTDYYELHIAAEARKASRASGVDLLSTLGLAAPPARPTTIRRRI